MKILKKLINSEDKKRLLTNYISLVLLQGTNFILPLISMPYLVRTLGVSNYGLLIFAQSIIFIFNIFVDFGFNLSATREISVNRENSSKINEIFSAVLLIKIFFVLVSFLVLNILFYLFNDFSNNRNLYYITFGLVIGQAIFPIWFFQGIERMKYITLLNLISKIFFTLSIFLFVQSKDDYIVAAILYSLGSIFVGLISIYIIFNKFNIKFVFLKFSQYMWYINDSKGFFLSRVSVSLYTSSSTVILGLLYNDIIVGYYAIAEKLYLVLRRLYQPISGVLYPYVAKSKNISLYKKIFTFTNIINILLLIALYNLAPIIINLIVGNIAPKSIEAFKMFIVIALFVVPSVLLGYPFLGALGYKNYANYSVVIGSVFHILGLTLLYLLNLININNIIILLFFTEIIVLFIRIYAVRKHNLWNIK